MVSMRVFVVDDSDLVRARLMVMLADINGVEVVGQARDGQSALQQIYSLKPDIVILDIQMPEIDGIQVLKKIKERQPETTVIMLTNYPFLLVKIKCLSAGANYFFDKSSELENLLETIQKMTGNE
jgi:DNA-binding NarL/FixJ family response regulator